MADQITFEVVKKNEYFKLLTGVTEKEFLAKRGTMLEELEPLEGNQALGPHIRLTHVDGVQQFDAGAFRSWSISEMEAAFLNPKEKEEEKESQCVFEIHTRHSAAHLPNVEVSALQVAADRNGKTMFQVASNFNCCENSSPFLKLNSGQFVTNLVLDDTQGPSATTSALASTIVRCHAAFYDKNVPPEVWGQNEKRQVENIGDKWLKPHFPLLNGKALCTPSKEPWLEDPKEQKRLLSVGKVGLHCGASAVYSRFMIGKPSLTKFQIYKIQNSPKFDQVFVSALDAHESGLCKLSANEQADKIKFILQLAYRGTYAAAAMRNSDTLVLTCVGGGAFANPLNDIANALAEAHVMYRSKCPHLKKVDADVSLFRSTLENMGVETKIVRHA